MLMLTDEQRVDLAEVLRDGERQGENGDCIACGETGWHAPKCRLARWLRELGGEAERQRQVDSAHAESVRVVVPSWVREKFPTSTALEAFAVRGPYADTVDFTSDTIFKPKGGE